MGSIWTRNQYVRVVAAPLTRTALSMLLIGALSAAAAATEPSLCAAGETPLFTCPVGHKLVSICNADGKATYHFGTAGKIEMSSQALFTANHAFSGGGETQISFRNNAYTYTVFDKTTRTSFSSNGQNDPDFTSGLIVQKNGKTISATDCASDAAIPASATHLIQPGPFIEH